MQQAVGQWFEIHAATVAWSTVGGAVGITILKYLPRALLELAALCFRDERRRRVCLELIRLRRDDATSLQSYLGQAEADALARPPSRRRRRQFETTKAADQP